MMRLGGIHARWLALPRAVRGAGAACLLVAAVLGWELLVPGRSLYRWDTLLYTWPILLETRAQLLSGQLPFWASSFCCGTPLLENINAGVLYPVRALTWTLPLGVGYRVFLLFHLWLGLLSMRALLRGGLRVSRVGAAVGAIVYVAGGYARAMWDTHNFTALPWIPLGLAGLLLARDPRRRLWAVPAAGACLSMLVLCGDFQAACLWVPVAASLGFCLRVPRCGRVQGAAVLAAGLLTAPQWVPTALAKAESYRATGLSVAEATECSFNPVRLVEFLVPHAYGTRAQWFGSALAGEGARKLAPWTTSMHVGWLGLLACGVAIRRRRCPAVGWALLLVLGFLLLSFGRFFPPFRLWLSLPVVGAFRYPEKYLLWVLLGAAVLAGQGARTLQALAASPRYARLRRRGLWLWAGALVVGTWLGALLVSRTTAAPLDACHWLAGRWPGLAVSLGLLLWLVVRRPARLRAALPVLVLLDLLAPWCRDLPTTRHAMLLEPPAVARIIRASDDPTGRFVRDRAAVGAPVPTEMAALSPAEFGAGCQTARMEFNSPRLWGVRSADGFSPLESGGMRAVRQAGLGEEGGPVSTPHELAEFCRLGAVRWLMTTPDRELELVGQGLVTDRVGEWGNAVLVHLPDMVEAECFTLGGEAAPGGGLPGVLHVRREAPGRIRVDLTPGAACTLSIKETYAPGWRAEDEFGAALEVVCRDRALIGVSVPEDTSQVRLAYRPRGWGLGVGAGLLGSGLLGVLVVRALGPAWRRKLWTTPATAAVVAAMVCVAVGLAARGHWSCTFDEGFHLARGMARLRLGDSRLNYSHPPLQNLAGAYFANLAHGESLRVPEDAAWARADVANYAVSFAMANRERFPALVQASRWGSCLFAALACATAALWAAGAGGVAAGWLAGLGLALNPNLLAHGHLTTTDMGVTALGLLGSFCLWRFCREDGPLALVGATVAFCLAAFVKYTGLIWLGAYLCLCLPLLAAAKGRARVLWHVLAAIVILAVLAVWLYGPEPQVIRRDAPGLVAGKACIAGRYVEGLLSQSRHSLEGHRAFFAGRRFTQSTWWHLPASIVLKSPAAWLLAACAAAAWGVFRGRRWMDWIPWLPFLAFCALLFCVNRMAVGIRHALALQVFGVVGAAVWWGRRRAGGWRHGLGALLLGASLAGAALSYPSYISYFPMWAGGVDRGHRWLVDSNYDWGQDLKRLEAKWAALRVANGGVPPHLLYYGFVDPRPLYGLSPAAPSLCGFMGRMDAEMYGADAYRSWVDGLGHLTGVAVGSVSALELDPFGLDLERVREAEPVGRLTDCFFLRLIK